MASLALVVSLIFLIVLFIGPITYILARIGSPKFLVYTLSGLCIFLGLWFITIGLPIWYIGCVPIYFGYISINFISKNDIQRSV